MKRFKHIRTADALVWLVPSLLTVPNIIICILGCMPPLYSVATVLVPLGVYLLIGAVSRNTPRTMALMFPFMVLSAFQIVVSFLYHDGSPIGVDMFLNIQTTNFQEVNELLSSLGLPVLLVTALYLPVFVASVKAWRRHDSVAGSVLRLSGRTGAVCLAVGAVCMMCCRLSSPGRYSLSADQFPVNAVSNLSEAIVRQKKTSGYRYTSRDFTYGAQTGRPHEKELYIAVIGETSRADNWELTGYGRRTNPRLRLYGDSLIAFGKAFSESNTTHKAVPMLLNTLDSGNFRDGIFTHKSIITAFKEAGFHTVFLSTQRRNHSFIEEYAGEADSVCFLSEGIQPLHPDVDVLPYVQSVIGAASHDKTLIVVHLYGSHYAYRDRYPADRAFFRPDDCRQAKFHNRRSLVNAYDNTVMYTDSILHELCAMTRNAGRNAAMIYCSDHGEDLFDDDRKRFLHASPVPTYWQLHVPFIIYMNDEYRASHPRMAGCAMDNRRFAVSSSRSYAHTLMHMAGVTSLYFDESQSLVGDAYVAPRTLSFLNDRNEPVDLMRWGFTAADTLRYKSLF